MIEITPITGEKFYLPLSVVRIMTKDEDGGLMLCYENPKSEITWRKIKSASMVTGSKKIT